MELHQKSCIRPSYATWFTTTVRKDAVIDIEHEMLRRVWRELEYHIDVMFVALQRDILSTVR